MGAGNIRDLSWLHFAIYLDAVLIAALSQVFLKRAAMRPHRSFVEEYLNPRVISAYGLFFLTTLVSMITYRKIPLSLGPVLKASVCLYMLIFGAVFLGERVTRRKLLTLALILDGVVFFMLSA